MEDSNWTQTFTGRKFPFLNPTVDDVDPLDIAHALSMLCRFGGHTHQFYSVAEHCVLLSRAIPERYAVEALLHDAAEAYLVDIPRPVKRQLYGYKEMEDRVLKVIFDRFEVDPYSEDDIVSPLVKDWDSRILLTERRALMPNTVHPWSEEYLEPLDVAIAIAPQKVAERWYLNAMRQLRLA